VKCLKCGKEFEAKRSTAKYCSDICRTLYSRDSETKPEIISETELSETLSETMTPEGLKSVVPANYGLSNCACLHCRATKSNKSDKILNHGAYKHGEQLAANELNRVSLPGDIDYVPVVKTEPGQLSANVIADIDRVNQWCKDNNIVDDKQKRIDKALHYQEVMSQHNIPMPEGITVAQ
jgi:hypothetical protein